MKLVITEPLGISEVQAEALKKDSEQIEVLLEG